jgi:hypothetical protein
MVKTTWVRVLMAAIGVIISGFALYWLLHTQMPHERLARLGLVSAILSAEGSLFVSWSATIGFLGRQLNWRPGFCQISGVLFALLGTLMFLTHGTNWSMGGTLVSMAFPAGWLSRWLAYGKMANQEFDKWLANEEMKRWHGEIPSKQSL